LIQVLFSDEEWDNYNAQLILDSMGKKVSELPVATNLVALWLTNGASFSSIVATKNVSLYMELKTLIEWSWKMVKNK
jgi:hypothetical protein